MTGRDPLLVGLDPAWVLTSISLGDSVDLYLAMIRRGSEEPAE